MAAGTNVANQSSDIVLLSNRLGDVPQALETGRDTLGVMRQNLFWAVAYNVIALPFAALGYVSPWLAALGMSISSMVVVVNALRVKMTSTLVFLLGLTVIFILLIGFGIFWAIKSGQFEDMEGPAQRILMDEDDPMLPSNRPVGPRTSPATTCPRPPSPSLWLSRNHCSTRPPR